MAFIIRGFGAGSLIVRTSEVNQWPPEEPSVVLRCEAGRRFH